MLLLCWVLSLTTICAGALRWVPSSLPTALQVVPHHKSNFTLDERCLAIGASVFVTLVKNVLGSGSGSSSSGHEVITAKESRP